MVTDIIQVENLEHSFGDVKAVDGISFAVKAGEIFSFLGPNGAGKSTTINVLTTLLPLQKGSVRIAGFDVAKDPCRVRESIGIVFQEETLDRDLTVWETLEFHGRIYSMPREARRARIDEMIKLVELESKRNEGVKKLSGGMKRRLEIARGLMTRPRVLFLDEPTLGLDPQTRMRMWDYIRQVNREGTTVFLTTHYMDEADSLSDRISIIDHGKIITDGTGEELKNALGEDMLYLDTTNNGRAKEVLSRINGVTGLQPYSRGLAVMTNQDVTRMLPLVLTAVKNADVEILSASAKKPTLDDVFVHHTGRAIREES